MKKSNTITFQESRTMIYDRFFDDVPYIKEWRRNPYTCLKSRFYMESSAIVVYLLLRTRITPNAVTIVYGFSGILAGILLAIPNTTTRIAAILIFFTRGILDWSDGALATLRKQESITGAVLDEYGGLLGILGLQIGLGFYVAQESGIMVFYYLIPLIPLFYAIKLSPFARSLAFTRGLLLNVVRDRRSGEKGSSFPDISSRKSRYHKIHQRVANFLDERARSVDFVLALVVLEMFTDIFVTWIIFLLYIVKGALLYLGNFYLFAYKGWIEKMLVHQAGESDAISEKDVA